VGECLRLVSEQNLKFVSIIREQKSAKKPDARDQFNQILDDIKHEKYQGIIA
jgi:hypothetical protein